MTGGRGAEGGVVVVVLEGAVVEIVDGLDDAALDDAALDDSVLADAALDDAVLDDAVLDDALVTMESAPLDGIGQTRKAPAMVSAVHPARRSRQPRPTPTRLAARAPRVVTAGRGS